MIKMIEPKESFITKLEDKFLKISNEKENKYNRFVDYNKSKKLKHKDIIKENINNLAKDKMLSYHIDREALKEDLVPCLVTATVKAKLHKSRTINKHISNIKIAYKSLNKFHTNILKSANSKLKYKINFIKTVEPHKTYMPHTHTIYYIKKEDIKEFEKIINSKKKININIGKIDIKPIIKGLQGVNGVKRYIEYLYKTTAKTKTKEELKKIDGYKKLTNIILYSKSRTKIKKEHLKYLSWYFGGSKKSIFNYEKLGCSSVIEAIETRCIIIGADGKNVNDVEDPLLILDMENKTVVNAKTGEMLYDGNINKNLVNKNMNKNIKIKRFKGGKCRKGAKHYKNSYKGYLGGLNVFNGGYLVNNRNGAKISKIIRLNGKYLINILMCIYIINKIR